MQRWVKIPKAAKYAGVGEKTIREWLRNGLPHSKPPVGGTLINCSKLDEFLEKFECVASHHPTCKGAENVDKLVSGILDELKNR